MLKNPSFPVGDRNILDRLGVFNRPNALYSLLCNPNFPFNDQGIVDRAVAEFEYWEWGSIASENPRFPFVDFLDKYGQFATNDFWQQAATSPSLPFTNGEFMEKYLGAASSQFWEEAALNPSLPFTNDEFMEKYLRRASAEFWLNAASNPQFPFRNPAFMEKYGRRLHTGFWRRAGRENPSFPFTEPAFLAKFSAAGGWRGRDVGSNKGFPFDNTLFMEQHAGQLDSNFWLAASYKNPSLPFLNREFMKRYGEQIKWEHVDRNPSFPFTDREFLKKYADKISLSSINWKYANVSAVSDIGRAVTFVRRMHLSGQIYRANRHDALFEDRVRTYRVVDYPETEIAQYDSMTCDYIIEKVMKLGEEIEAAIPQDALCSVCLEVLRSDDYIMLIPCGHIFHESCAKRTFQWQKSQNCPICRQLPRALLSKEESVNLHTSTQDRMKAVREWVRQTVLFL